MAITVTGEKQDYNLSFYDGVVGLVESKITLEKQSYSLTFKNAIVTISTNWTEKQPVNTVWTKKV